MKVVVVGIEKINYQKKDGTRVDGYNLHFTSPLEDNRGSIGSKAGTQYVSKERFGYPMELGEYNFDYGVTSTGKAFLASVEPLF